MDVKAQLNNLRTAPRKVRLVADLVRGKSVDQARSLLMFTIKKPSDLVLKLLNSAVDSALTNFKLQEQNLYISKITVDEGPKLKRWHPMSRGRAYPIMKRTSNITLIVSERNKTEIKEQKMENKQKKPVNKGEKVIAKKQRTTKKQKK